MKAKDLISLLQNNPDAKVVVSTVSYYEKSHYEAGYERVPPSIRGKRYGRFGI